MKYVLPALCLLLASCSTNYPPERTPIVPQAAPSPPPIIITVRGGDQSTRSEMPRLEEYLQRRREEPEFEETLYQRKPVFDREQYNYTPYTRPDSVPQTPLEYTPRYPYYDK